MVKKHLLLTLECFCGDIFVAPAYQMIMTVYEDFDDCTVAYLSYANRIVESILLPKVLQRRKVIVQMVIFGII